MRRPLLILLALVAAGCGGGGSAGASGEEPAATPAPQTTGCERVQAPAPKADASLPKPTTRLKRGTGYVATVATSCGEFQITLDPRRAPRTGGSFAYLAAKRFFDGTTFHRIVPGFVIQGGDPKGTGEGGPGYSVVEAPPRDLAYTKGVVAMAKTATDPAGASGSQFFVVTGEDAQLPPEYALLGKVTAGQDVVDRIAALQTDANEAPVDPVVIKSVRVAETAR